MSIVVTVRDAVHNVANVTVQSFVLLKQNFEKMVFYFFFFIVKNFLIFYFVLVNIIYSVECPTVLGIFLIPFVNLCLLNVIHLSIGSLYSFDCFVVIWSVISLCYFFLDLLSYKNTISLLESFFMSFFCLFLPLVTVIFLYTLWYIQSPCCFSVGTLNNVFCLLKGFLCIYWLIISSSFFA